MIVPAGYRLSLIIRVVAVVLTLSVIFLFSEQTVASLFIILGLAHFALAFWYQKGAGRWKVPAIGLLIFSFALLAFLVNATSTAWFFVLTGIYTSLHMAWDEVHLLKGKHSLVRTLEYLPFVILYGGLLTDANFGTNFFIPALSISIFVLIGYGAVSWFKKQKPDSISLVNLSWGVFAFVVYLSYLASSGVPAYIWFLGLAVVHYLIWYGEYARKVAHNPERRKTYYRRVFLVNGLLFAGFFLWSFGGVSLGSILYAPVFFYVWAFLHVTTSTRLSELPSMVSLRS